jgi:hypothetical protein
VVVGPYGPRFTILSASEGAGGDREVRPAFPVALAEAVDAAKQLGPPMERAGGVPPSPPAGWCAGE